MCSYPRYSWVTYFILSNICIFFPACLTYLIYSPFIGFINFFHLITLSSSYQTSVIFSPLSSFHPINATAVHTTHNNNSVSLLSSSPGVFGHRAILIWGGDRGMAWVFLEEQPVTVIGDHMPTPLASSDPPPPPPLPPPLINQPSLLCLDPPCLTVFDSILNLLAPPCRIPWTPSPNFSLPPCLTPAESILYFVGPFCQTTFWRSSAFAIVPQLHPFPSIWSFDSTQPPHLTTPLWGDSFSKLFLDFTVLSLLLFFFGTSPRVHLGFTSRTGHDNKVKWDSSEDTVGNCVTL